MFRRIFAAWQVLMGQRLTPLQIHAEWVEYQQVFRDLLEQFSASLAREAKAEKKRIQALGSGPVAEAFDIKVDPQADRKARKAALYRKMFANRDQRSAQNVEAQ